jgi:hypothetical protein
MSPYDEFGDSKISTINDVIELNEGYPVELWSVGGVVVIRAYNEGGNRYTDVPLNKLAEVLRHGPDRK